MSIPTSRRATNKLPIFRSPHISSGMTYVRPASSILSDNSKSPTMNSFRPNAVNIIRPAITSTIPRGNNTTFIHVDICFTLIPNLPTTFHKCIYL